MSEPDELKSKYTRIDGALEMRRHLSSASESSCFTVLWTKDQALVLRSVFNGSYTPARGFGISLPDDVEDTESFVASLQEKIGETWFFNIFVPNQVVLSMSCPLTSVTEKGLTFESPKELFQLQRRVHARFEVPSGYDLKLGVPNPVPPKEKIFRELVDISAGGLSFLVPESHIEGWIEGTVLEHVTLSIQNQKLIFSIEIRHARRKIRKKNLDWIKVGTSFRRIRREDQEFIERYIMENTFTRR